MRRGKGKGSNFEREICKKLSLWWSKGQSDSVFWRTAGSGGRATRRSQKGMSTANQDGDVTAVEDTGRILTASIAIEIKRVRAGLGTLQDLIDSKSTKSEWWKWFEQANQAKPKQWMLIAKRDQHKTLVAMPAKVWKWFPYDGPRIILKLKLYGTVVVVDFDHLLENVPALSVETNMHQEGEE